MHRRQFIRAVPLSIAGSLSFLDAPRAQAPSRGLTPKRYSSFAEWIDAARGAALEFIADSGAENPNRFMQFLALWATAMPDVPKPDWPPIAGANRRLDAAMIAPGRPFVVTALKMAPGCRLPAHCHPGGGGISLCTKGSVTIQHYDLVAGSPRFSETGAVAEIEAVSAASLQQNQFTLFTPTQANLHELQAGPDGSTVIDIIVQWRGVGEFSFFKHRDEPQETSYALGHRLSGTWVGMSIAHAYPDSA
jgi:hypothetical protein